MLRRGPALLLSVALLALNVGWVSARLGFLHKPHQVAEHDHLRYLAMARGAQGDQELARQSPYCWRVAVPAAAALLARAGLKLNLAFWLLTNVALLAFLLALDAWLEALGFGRGERLLGLALTGLVQGCLRWFEVQYWMTDPAGLALLVLTLLALRQGRLPLAGALGCAAAFVRETQVVAWPWIFLDRLRRQGLPDAVRATLLTCGPALLVYALLRWWIVPASGPALRDAIVDNLGFRWRHLLDNQLYLMTVGTWGALVPLLLLFPGRLLLVARRETGAVSLLLAVYVTTFLISNNNERPLAYAVPVVLPAALLGLRWLSEASGLSWRALGGAALLLQLFAWQQTLFTGLGISVYQPTNLAVLAAMAAAWLAGLWLRRGAPPVTRMLRNL